MRQQGICESLQNRLELASSENAQLEDALRNETEERKCNRVQDMVMREKGICKRLTIYSFFLQTLALVINSKVRPRL